MVQQHYAALGRANEFLSAVGDGALWTVLLASSTPEASAAFHGLIPQAAALAAVFHCQGLLARTDPCHLSSLVQSVFMKKRRGAYHGPDPKNCRSYFVTDRDIVGSMG
jgi:hypothetical protein